MKLFYFAENKKMKHGKQLHLIMRRLLILFLAIFCTQSVMAGVTYSLNFRGEAIDGGNMLSWKTLSEVDNQHFIIERSKDGIRYEQAAKIEGAGTTDDLKQYRFLDITAGTSRTFYRLAQVDYNGATTMSHTVILSASQEERHFEITALNSTITDRYFTLTVNASLDSDMEYRVMTQMGDIKKKGNSQLLQGMNAIAVDLGSMETGTYQFAIKVKNEIEVLVIEKIDKETQPEDNLATKNKTIRN